MRGLSRGFSSEAQVRLRYPVSRRAVPPLESHSQPAKTAYSSLTVFTVPVLQDAYSYILVDHRSKEAALIDPREPELVLRTAERENIKVTSVLCTDHLDGGANAKLLEKFPGLHIYGFDDRIGGLTHQLGHGEMFKVGEQKVRGLFTPCFTAGSGAFHLLSARKLGFSKSPNRNHHSILFSGDTLSVGGCGPFVEGSERDMYNNLIHIIAALPSDTDVYCAHEHTVQNLEFANALLREQDDDVSKALERARVTRSAFVPTVPAVLEDEFLTNPFMRANHMAVMRAAGCGVDKAPQEVMRRLRDKKDAFDQRYT